MLCTHGNHTAPVDRDGYYRTHADQEGRICQATGQPTTARAEVLGRQDRRRILSREELPAWKRAQLNARDNTRLEYRRWIGMGNGGRGGGY